METSDRIALIRRSLKINQEEFADQIGINRVNLSDIERKRKKTVSDDLVSKISSEFNVNINWLLTGKGEMFNNEKESSDSSLTASNDKNYKLVPLINIDAVGGMHTSNEIIQEPEFIQKFIPFEDAVDGDLCITVSSNSMYPTCPSGTQIHIRKVENWKEYFGYGNIFVLQLSDGRRVIKEVTRYDENPKDYILCISHNKDYPIEELPKSMITGVWKVIHILINRGW